MLCAPHICLPLVYVGMHSPWLQSYDPTHYWWLSTACAALPLIALLVALLGPRLKAHYSALIALAVALAVVIGIFRMPVDLALRATVYGAAYGLFPIFWIIFPVIFLYKLTIRAGRFGLLQECLVGVTEDSRLQLLLIAFAFGAFFEGAAGFGTPVAVCGTILLGLGFSPLQAAGLALLANTAPVAFGALGIPIVALHGVTGLDTLILTRVTAALLTPFCVLVPFWLIWAFAGFRRMVEIWPAVLLTGVTFGTTQFLMAALHGPWLVDITASVVTICVLVLFLFVWRPKQILNAKRQTIPHRTDLQSRSSSRTVLRAALPWFILALCITVWGTPRFSQWLDAATTVHMTIPGLHQVIFRMPPAVPSPAAEAAVFNFNWLSATGTVEVQRRCSSLLGNRYWNPVHHDHDSGSHGTWFRHPILRSRRYARPRLRPHRSPLSFLWNAHRLARNRLDRLRHLFERPLRQSAKTHCPATGNLAFHDGCR
jgi:lactate permease